MTGKSKARPESPESASGGTGRPLREPRQTRQEDPRQDALLDEALEETFPASDPVSVYRLH